MKKTLLILAATATSMSAIFSCSDNTVQEERQEVIENEIEEPEPTEAVQDTIKGSIKSETSGQIGNANIKINYHSPGVKGRIIWGGLVPYGQVWVTGAHMATSIETDKDLLFGSKALKAGKYALFTIPGEEEWTIIFNKDWKQHLSDNYAETEDVLRVQVKPEKLKQHQERLNYEIVRSADAEGALLISWDKMGIKVPVKEIK
jgi:hypothetical protein